MDSENLELYFTIAGSLVRISGEKDALFEDHGMLDPFRVEKADPDHTIHCQMVDEIPRPDGELVFSNAERRVYREGSSCVSYIGRENAPFIRVARRGNGRIAQFARKSLGEKISPKAVLTALEVEAMIAQAGGILLHASCIEYQGAAILFTAPSGTGKSTQAELWRECRGAEVINGDRIMIRFGRSGAEAVGIPFSGSSGICKNRILPIRAIVYLSQAPENGVAPLRGVKAFRNLWEGCSVHTWDREDTANAMDAVQKLIASVPIYHLACTPDERAVSALEQVLSK